MIKTVLLLAIGAGLLPALASAQITRKPGETAQIFAERALGLPANSGDSHADAHFLETDWNGKTVVFADYLVVRKGFDAKSKEPFDITNRVLVALEDTGRGEYRKLDVTVGEEDGGIADIAAIGFANADKDPAKELIVILKWVQSLHAFYEGTEYEVRIFDDAKLGQSGLAYLKPISASFGGPVCDCNYSEDNVHVRKTRARFKTIADVKRHLKQLGF